MTPTGNGNGCAAVADLLPELALGIVGGTERAEVLVDLDQCSICRDITADYAAAVDALPILLGEAEPPPGFEKRTLARLAEARDPRAARRSRLTRILAVAALVAAVMIASVAAVRIIDARDDSGGGSQLALAPMTGHSGRPAGHAVWSDAERRLWLDVDYGDRSGEYRLETVDADDQVTDAGTVTVAEGRGAWAGKIDGPTPTKVRLVGDDGRIWCTASFT